MIQNRCNWCGKDIEKTGIIVYCNKECKAAYEQCTQIKSISSIQKTSYIKVS